MIVKLKMNIAVLINAGLVGIKEKNIMDKFALSHLCEIRF
jgi:hypothetical protein